MDDYSFPVFYDNHDEAWYSPMTLHDARAITEHQRSFNGLGNTAPLPHQLRGSDAVGVGVDSPPSDLHPTQPFQPAVAVHYQDPYDARNHQSSCSRDFDQEVCSRPRLTADQTAILEDTYLHNPRPNTQQKQMQARELGLSLDKVNNWFQNRRAKSKQQEKQRRTVLEYNDDAWNGLGQSSAGFGMNSDSLISPRSAPSATPTMPSSNESHQPLTPNDPVPPEAAWSQMNMLFRASIDEAAEFQAPFEDPASILGLRNDPKVLRLSSPSATSLEYRQPMPSSAPIDQFLTEISSNQFQNFPIDRNAGAPFQPDWLIVNSPGNFLQAEQTTDMDHHTRTPPDDYGHGYSSNGNMADADTVYRQMAVVEPPTKLETGMLLHQPTAIHHVPVNQLDHESQTLWQHPPPPVLMHFTAQYQDNLHETLADRQNSIPDSTPPPMPVRISSVDYSAQGSPNGFTYMSHLSMDPSSRRPSLASDLARDLNIVHIQSSSSQNTSDEEVVFKTPPFPGRNLGTRRKQRPAPLSTRTVSTSAIQMSSPGIKSAALPNSVRRMKSAGSNLNIASNVINGRIQKSGASSAQRSPLYTTTFQEDYPGQRLQRAPPASHLSMTQSEMVGSFQASITSHEDADYHSPMMILQNDTPFTTSHGAQTIAPSMMPGLPYVISPPTTPFSHGQHLAPPQWNIPQSAPAHMMNFPCNPSPPPMPVMMPPNHQSGCMMVPQLQQFSDLMNYQQPPPMMANQFPYVPSQNFDVLQPHTTRPLTPDFYHLIATQPVSQPAQKPLEVIFCQSHAPPVVRLSSPCMQKGPMQFTFQNLGPADLKAQYKSEA